MNKQFSCIVSAGELSGDQHAAGVVSDLLKLIPGLNVSGYGGQSLADQGVHLISDYRQTGGVMGFVDVIKNFKNIYKSYKAVCDKIKQDNPSLIVLVDYADFNLRLARYAHSLNIPVLYFIPPKVWAWRESRVSLIKKYCSKVCVIFPFEEPYFQSKGVDAKFVGHPFCDEPIYNMDRKVVRDEVCAQLGLDYDKKIVTVLVGSRKKEVQRHLEVAIDAIRIIKQTFPDLQVIFAKAPSIKFLDLPADITEYARVSDMDSRKLMLAADAGMIKSGTSTLEATFCKTPFVCFYDAPKFTEVVLRLFTSITTVALPNLVIPNTVKELVQGQCQGQNIAKEILDLFDRKKSEELIKRLDLVVQKFGSSVSAYANVAGIAADLIRRRNG